MITYSKLSIIIYILVFHLIVKAANYADQHYVWYMDSIEVKIESSDGVVVNDDGSHLELASDKTQGYVILTPSSSQEPFNRGLPSWNGTSPPENSSFLIQMRFPYNGGWSPWLTVGYWQDYIWNYYGQTSYNGGYIDYDYVKLYSYQSSWQFKIYMYRTSTTEPSPTLHKLSFFVSDKRTTDDLNLTQIVNDNPEAIQIPTDFLYQYGIDDEIGGSICSPTSVSMVLNSYDIDVDPLQFARDTFDPYYELFGVWPRVVQSASQFGLDGAVTRYRTWSEAREILANGGRVVMSVGPPLYSGHLMMLGGFTAAGNPIVHDPARENGYSYVYNKTQLSQSWFEKGGVAYTFYPADSVATAIEDQPISLARKPDGFVLLQNYPNPFNPTTKINYELPVTNYVSLSVYNVVGQRIADLVSSRQAAGSYSVIWNAENQPSGIYFIMLRTGSFSKVVRAQLVR